MENKYFKSVGDLGEDNMGRQSIKSEISLDERLFGRRLDRTQAGYDDAIARRDAFLMELNRIDSRIDNKMATAADWDRRDEVVANYQKEYRAAETIKQYLKNKGVSVEKQILKNSLKPAGDLAGDINMNRSALKTKKDIDDYLLTIVSGKTYGSVCELGVLVDQGSIIVSLEELKRMVNEGYNIISAQCLNANIGLIDVKYQCYLYDEKLMEHRRRF